MVPVDFYDAIASQMKLSHSIWEQFSISVECVAPEGHKQLCMPVLGHSHFFLVVVDINSRHFTLFDSMTRPHQDRRYAHVSQNLSHFLSLKLGVRRGLNFTHDIRQDLPQQTNGSDCGIFTCRYIYGLITGTGFLFDNRTSDVQRWLTQFILDEATSQADTTRGNIQIYEPPLFLILTPQWLSATCVNIVVCPYQMYFMFHTHWIANTTAL